MEKPKLIICDVDDTLILKHHPITPFTKKVIKAAQDLGIYFCICSGRPLFQLKEFIDNWEMESPDFLVGLNGCSILDVHQKKEYTFNLLKKQWIKDIIKLMEPFDANISMYINESQVFSKNDYYYLDSKNRTKYPCLVYEDIKEMYQSDNAKIMFRITQQQMPMVEQHVKQFPSENYHGFKTGPLTFEFCHKDCDKSFGMKKIAEAYNIDLKEIWAFGDTSNDNRMLQDAGVGICLQNGSEDTKQIANIVTTKTCKEDGLAWFLVENIQELKDLR